MLSEKLREIVAQAKKILIVQPENPDGDSLGAALALEQIFGEMTTKTGEKREIFLHCPVQIPTYLRYVDGWDRVEPTLPNAADLILIVDTVSEILLSKTLALPGAPQLFAKTPSITFDHHVAVEPNLPFATNYVIGEKSVSTGELIFDLAQEQNWPLDEISATNLYISIQADSLGLTTVATTAHSFAVCGELVALGANPHQLEENRRELMKKKAEILAYKGELISRIEYLNDGRTALIFVPFDEIQKYSNDYNPTMLVLDEMRLVIGVDMAIGVKTYPDGKLTGKLRSNLPISHLAAKHFGGDGHPFASGFRTYMNYRDFVPEFAKLMNEIYAQYDAENSASNSEKSISNKNQENHQKKSSQGKINKNSASSSAGEKSGKFLMQKNTLKNSDNFGNFRVKQAKEKAI